MKTNKLYFLHFFYWGLYLIQQIITIVFYDHSFPVFSATFFVISFFCFYFNYFVVVPRFFDINKLYKIVIGYFISVAFFVLLRYSVEEMFLPAFFGFRNYSEKTGLGFYFYDNIYFSFTTIFVSTVFSLLKLMTQSEEEKRELMEQKKNSELQALKTQINPHFIFNSLNNIYSLVYQNSEKALPAIQELSQLLRYSTKDLEKDFILLDKEIGYLESLIELEKLRIKNPELLIINKNISHPNLNISPMLLVPFVENAFKHGDFKHKGFVLNISDDHQMLHFNLQNFKINRSKDVVSGIGINNVKKRLEILYPKKHELKITETETEFSVDLKIDLK